MITGLASKGQPLKSRFALTITPTIVSYYVGIQPGFEYRFSPRLALLTEVGIPMAKINEAFEKESVLRLTTQAKWLLAKSGRGKYVSLQTGVVFRRFQTADSGFFTVADRADTGFIYGGAVIHSPVITVNVNYGRELKLGSHFFLDMSAGLGFRSILTRYDVGAVRPVAIVRAKDRIFPAPDPAYSCNCTLTRFRFSLAMRLGYRL